MHLGSPDFENSIWVQKAHFSFLLYQFRSDKSCVTSPDSLFAPYSKFKYLASVVLSTSAIWRSAGIMTMLG